MANKTYVTKGYSTYTNIPTQQDIYDHDSKHSGSQYVVETKSIQHVRAPASGYNDYVGSPSKVELLKEYVHSPTMSGVSPNYGLRYETLSLPVTPDKHTRGYFSEEPNRIHSGTGYVRTGGNSGLNKSWLTVGPPATNHQLVSSTNNINEALGLLEESVYYSPRADPRRRGVLDDMSTRAQPLEPHRRYARPAFVARPDDARNFTNTGNAIGSHDGARRYRGPFVA